MADWYDAGEHDGTFSFAGWSREGEWHDVEGQGDPPLESVPDSELYLVDEVTVHYVNPYGDDIYVTIHGPFEDLDYIIDYVDYALEPYGVE